MKALDDDDDDDHDDNDDNDGDDERANCQLATSLPKRNHLALHVAN